MFGRGACQSSSFWWPQVIDFDSETWYIDYYFINNTLNTHLTNRPPQTILIDVGEEEDDAKMHMVRAATEVYGILSAMDGFETEENLWVHTYPGQLHTFESWIGRSWSALSILSKGRAYP